MMGFSGEPPRPKSAQGKAGVKLQRRPQEPAVFERRVALGKMRDVIYVKEVGLKDGASGPPGMTGTHPGPRAHVGLPETLEMWKETG